MWDCYDQLIFPELKHKKRGGEIKVLTEIITHDRDIQTSERMQDFLDALNTHFMKESKKLASIYFVR